MVGAARHVRRFGLTPKVALCSSSQFGNLDSTSGRLARAALAILDGRGVAFEYEGEMQTDVALDPELRERLYPGGRLEGRANVLVYTNSDAAGAGRNLLKSVAEGLEVGPILMGMGNRAHIVTPSVALRAMMVRIACHGGLTQIGKVLDHVTDEAAKKPVAALVYVGDAMEENIDRLCDKAGRLALRGTRAFMFLEGRDPTAERAYREIARLTGGAMLPFDRSSADELRELLSAVAAFAAGGRPALEASPTRSARRLLADLGS
jgi:hypothetical protein